MEDRREPTPKMLSPADTLAEISFSDDDLDHVQLPYEEPLPLAVSLNVANV